MTGLCRRPQGAIEVPAQARRGQQSTSPGLSRRLGSGGEWVSELSSRGTITQGERWARQLLRAASTLDSKQAILNSWVSEVKEDCWVRQPLREDMKLDGAGCGQENRQEQIATWWLCPFRHNTELHLAFSVKWRSWCYILPKVAMMMKWDHVCKNSALKLAHVLNSIPQTGHKLRVGDNDSKLGICKDKHHSLAFSSLTPTCLPVSFHTTSFSNYRRRVFGVCGLLS